jgi:glutathione S-transferase
VPAVAAAGAAEWQEVARALTLAVQNGRFLLGEAFSLADVMVGGSLWLADFLGVLAPYPALVAYFDRVRDRPAFRRAYADSVTS